MRQPLSNDTFESVLHKEKEDFKTLSIEDGIQIEIWAYLIVPGRQGQANQPNLTGNAITRELVLGWQKITFKYRRAGA
jgi:hypothetical protein